MKLSELPKKIKQQAIENFRQHSIAEYNANKAALKSRIKYCTKHNRFIHHLVNDGEIRNFVKGQFCLLVKIKTIPAEKLAIIIEENLADFTNDGVYIVYLSNGYSPHSCNYAIQKK